MTSDPPTPSPPLIPYASALPAPAQQTPSEIFRQGPLLILRSNTLLPARCILCGQDAVSPPIRLVFTWDASFQVTRVSTLQLRDQGVVQAFLCRMHRRRWAAGRWLGAIGIALSILIMAAGMTLEIFSESSTVPLYTSRGIFITLAGFAATIFCLFYFTLSTRTLSCNRIHEGYLYLAGASSAFLQPFTDLPQNPPS